jgi:hypothetical protein
VQKFNFSEYMSTSLTFFDDPADSQKMNVYSADTTQAMEQQVMGCVHECELCISPALRRISFRQAGRCRPFHRTIAADDLRAPEQRSFPGDCKPLVLLGVLRDAPVASFAGSARPNGRSFTWTNLRAFLPYVLDQSTTNASYNDRLILNALELSEQILE